MELHLYSNSDETVAAETVEQAHETWRKYMVEDVGEDESELDGYCDLSDWVPLLDEEPLTCGDCETREKWTKPAGEWAREFGRVGIFSSQNWC
jgi:hypothetical protein